MTAPVSKQELIAQWVSTHGLTPRDTYLVDLDDLLFSPGAPRPDPGADLVAELAQRRQSGGQWTYLLNNPAEPDELAPISVFRHASLSLWPRGGYVPATVLADAERGLVLFSPQDNVLRFPEDAATGRLTEAGRASVVDVIDRHVRAWPHTIAEPGAEPSPYSGWQFAVALEDYRVYRYESYSEKTAAPPGFDAVLATMWSLTDAPSTPA
ncbi:MAG: hypothetical protein LBK54_10935 [Propionibacteriaceae bacterium]|jgi:hypothetical protein|nr:hypothetical protein [Propionibacteriaceae bacterium]